jgi:hypothetical protein
VNLGEESFAAPDRIQSSREGGLTRSRHHHMSPYLQIAPPLGLGSGGPTEEEAAQKSNNPSPQLVTSGRTGPCVRAVTCSDPP